MSEFSASVAARQRQAKGKKGRKIRRNPEKPIQKYRFYIQSFFLFLSLAIGVRFYFFIRFLESGGETVFVSRPPGVDAYLPISSMMSLYHFIKTGVIQQAHPAGLFIFLAIVLISLAIGKAFCSWICPVGMLSEWLGNLSERLFGKIKLPKFLDYPLRSLKYLLLAFFVYSIFILMSDAAISAFLGSPYNQVADIKMYYFFADISKTALIVITVLFLGSIFIRNFWCRYLCPYGALLGIAGLLSPHKIRRTPESCIDCAKCAKACPSFIKVDKVETVWSDECSSCLQCVDACPVADTLEVKSLLTRRKIPKKKIAVAIVSLFLVITGIGMITGNWQNTISKEQYLQHYEKLEQYGHPTSTSDVRSLNRDAAGQER